MLNPYLPILERCEPFLIAHDGIAPILQTSPAGITIPPANIFHPQQRKNGAFLQMLALVDKLTFGPFGMDMPGWVFYDCAVMPGAVFGLGIRAGNLEPWARQAMNVPDDYTGLVPVSQFIAIPILSGFAGGRAVPDTWLLYTLESMNQISPGIAPFGTLHLTLYLGLQVFPIQELWGTTQWRSPKVETYSDLGPLELVTAYTPAHSMPRTFSFRMHPRSEMLSSVLAAPRAHPDAPPPNSLLDADDPQALIELQREIEAGHRVVVVGRPLNHGTYVRVPLFREKLVHSPA
ncbi:MAG: hypothetical protein HY902_07660 [Deltaproteobacteria bacterium]|nr:hypothetical protein [Deltaproteobacteria bacterium]